MAASDNTVVNAYVPDGAEIATLARSFALAVVKEIADRVTRLQGNAVTQYGEGYNDGVRAAFKELCSRIGVSVSCTSCSWVVAAPYALSSLTKYVVCPRCSSRALKSAEVLL